MVSVLQGHCVELHQWLHVWTSYSGVKWPVSGLSSQSITKAMDVFVLLPDDSLNHCVCVVH